MDQQKIIRDLDARAAALGLSMRDVCVAAKLHPTTVSRWKLSEHNPHPVSATMRSLQRLIDFLDEAEAEAMAA
jgi:hypothetical protein